MSTQFPCPHCQAPLRIRNRAYLGKELDCPHCDQPIRIVAGIDDEFVAEPLQELPRPSASVVPPRTLTPQLFGWIVAGGLAVLLLLIVLWPVDNASSETANTDPPPSESANSDEEPPADQTNEPAATPSPPSVGEPPEPADIPDVPGIPVARVEQEPPPLPIDVPLPAPRNADDQADLAEAPIEPLLATEDSIEPPVRVDVRKSLGVRVSQFDQPRPVAIRELLFSLEEFVGVPIRTDDNRIEPAQLDRTVTVSLNDTTLGEILSTVTRQAGLSYLIQDDEIVLVPSQE